MGHLLFRSLLVGLVAALTCCTGLGAQTEAARLCIRTVSGESTFRMGERISIELAFTAPAEAQLALIMATYDRSGRMSYESFEVSPASGSSDPLASYFNGGWFMGGGLSGLSGLSQKAVTMRLDVNEWVRFDRPGDYTVTVHSSRVVAAGKPASADGSHSIGSNPLRLHIIAASPEWQHAKLAAALTALAAKSPQFGPLRPETAAAIADVRFLGSADSVAVLATGLGEDEASRNAPFAFGLIGLPPSLHELAVRVLRARLEDPQIAVSSWLIQAYAALAAGPGNAPEEAAAAHAAAREQVVRSAIAALARKTGKARAATADLLLREDSATLTVADKAAVAQALGSIFGELPEESQAMLLNWQWDTLRSVIAPQALAAAAALPVQDAGSREMQNGQRMDLKSSALRRWYELDPSSATEAAYRQIGSASPSLDAGRLWFLPPEAVPQFEAMWAQALLAAGAGANPEVLAGLMVRFGTGQFASQVAAKVRGTLDEEACAPQAAMVGYVVKFDPEMGRSLLRDVLQARKNTGCYRMLFDDVGRYARGPVLTDVALETIADIDPQTAGDAVRYLAKYGDERSKAPMLVRYRSWTDAWSAKADELRPNLLKPSPNWGEEVLGEALGRALLANQGWITDETLRSEVLKRCVGEQMCRSLEQVTAEASHPEVVSVFQSGELRYIHVGPYEIADLQLLQAKLAQYPQGTGFVLVTTDGSGDGLRLKQAVQAVFAAAGMKLRVQPQP